MDPDHILEARELTKRFGSGDTEVYAVRDVSIDVAKGELVTIMGPSGSGKTTLLSMLGGLLRPTSGHIYLGGADLAVLPEKQLPSIRAESIGFIFQSFNLIDALNVEENVLMPAQLVAGGVVGARHRAAELLDKLGLAKRRHAYPRTLSGGERQRVAIARALINRPPIILADEPTGNLDSRRGQEVMMVLHDVARDEQCSVVMVTHDPRVEDVADRVLWLEDGQIRDRKQEKHAWVRDPVCGMPVDQWTADLTAEYEGHRFAFCSRRCLERFETEPKFYAEKNDASDREHRSEAQ